VRAGDAGCGFSSKHSSDGMVNIRYLAANSPGRFSQRWSLVGELYIQV
jgi:hypothetical protein